MRCSVAANLPAGLRFAQVDFDALCAGKNSLTPLESVEWFFQEQMRGTGF